VPLLYCMVTSATRSFYNAKVYRNNMLRYGEFAAVFNFVVCVI
jgi:hypothetical protein